MSETNTFINYDGYYVIETKRIFARRLGNLLTDNLSFSGGEKGRGAMKVKMSVKKANDYDYIVNLKAGDKKQLYDHINSLNSFLKQEIEDLSGKSGEKLVFSVNFSEPVIFKENMNWFNVLLGVLAGIVFGIFTAFIRPVAQ